MTGLNWGKLYEQGRCREIGISWTEEEARELYIDKTATVGEIRARYYPEKIAELQNAIKEVQGEPIEEEIEDVIEEVEEEQEEKKEITIEDLKQEATDLGIRFSPNIGFEKLQERINDHKNNS